MRYLLVRFSGYFSPSCFFLLLHTFFLESSRIFAFLLGVRDICFFSPPHWLLSAHIVFVAFLVFGLTHLLRVSFFLPFRELFPVLYSFSPPLGFFPSSVEYRFFRLAFKDKVYSLSSASFCCFRLRPFPLVCFFEGSFPLLPFFLFLPTLPPPKRPFFERPFFFLPTNIKVLKSGSPSFKSWREGPSVFLSPSHYENDPCASCKLSAPPNPYSLSAPKLKRGPKIVPSLTPSSPQPPLTLSLVFRAF